MNLRSAAKLLRAFPRHGVARFPFGRPGDPVLKVLPLHTESIPVRSVVGSVDRYAQIDRKFRPIGTSKGRFLRIVEAMQEGKTFPPIEVYRLHGMCYVVDGHHRVAAALQTGQLYLDAEVSECMVPGQSPEYALEEARVRFALRTGLRSLLLSEPARYDQALAQIHEHRWYLGERGQVFSVQEAADDWYDTIYLPVARNILEEGLTPARSAQGAGDAYLQLCDLKYCVSRERGEDIGFAQAVQVSAEQRQRSLSVAFFGRLIRLRTMA